MEKGFEVYGCPAEGCKYCVKGEKLVLFITGICSQRCNFCPVSEKKFGADDIYANEWKISSKEDMLEEIKLTDAQGAGITGGDPLCKIDRTVEYIKFLKEKKRKQFHIHLYTPFKLVTEENMKALFESGLDEIRFHPKLDDDSEWDKIEIALKYNWDAGLEIPCLPDKVEEMKKLVDYFNNKVKFLNLNELEFSDTEVEHYNMDEYETRNDESYAVKGSKESAFEIIEYARSIKSDMSVYFCSSFLKDRIQMGNRIIRRAKAVAKSYDEITEEGMLIRGCIYLDELKPDVNYREKLEKVDKKEIMKKLNEVKIDLPHDIDEKKLRITCSANELKKKAEEIKKLNLVPAIVEEYPTEDAIEVEVEFL